MKAGPDRLFGAGWFVFGAAVLVAAWRMDRLEAQNINPWSAPGLLPGLVGALMMLFGAVLFLRRAAPAIDFPPAAPARIALALFLCVGFAAGLIGHGLMPFWLAAALFLFVAITAFRWLDREPGADTGPARIALEAAVIAIVASGAISLLFQEVFLVRLP